MTCIIANAEENQTLRRLRERDRLAIPFLPCYGIVLVRSQLLVVSIGHVDVGTDSHMEMSCPPTHSARSVPWHHFPSRHFWSRQTAENANHRGNEVVRRLDDW